jgi:hypothetical protein
MIMLDERSAALTPRVVLDIFHTIHRISRAGTTVLLVEQKSEWPCCLLGIVTSWTGSPILKEAADRLLHDVPAAKIATGISANVEAFLWVIGASSIWFSIDKSSFIEPLVVRGAARNPPQSFTVARLRLCGLRPCVGTALGGGAAA